MKITEKDLYCKDGCLDVVRMPVKRKNILYERRCIFIKPMNAYVPLTTLINNYLKTIESPEFNGE